MVNIKKTALFISIFTIFIWCGASCATPFDELQSDDDLFSIHYENIVNSFIIESFVINEEYTLLYNNEVIFLTDNNLDNMFNQPTLIGYDFRNVYLLHYEENDILVSRIDYISKHIEKGIYESKEKIIFASYIKDGLLYLGEAELVNGQLNSVLKRINLKNDNERPYEEVLFQNIYPRLPSINFSDDYVLISYSNGDAYILGYIYHNDNEFIEIFRSDYSVTDSYLYTGEIPLFANGDKYGIFFQVISLDNEAMDFEGNQTLYYYSFSENKYIPKLILSDKTTHVNGNGDIVILNDYAIEEPRTVTGKIISLKDNSITNIPKTRPANSINYSVIKDNLIFTSSNENIYVFDSDKQTFASMDISSMNRTEIKIFEDSFGFLDMTDGSYVFQLIRYSIE